MDWSENVHGERGGERERMTHGWPNVTRKDVGYTNATTTSQNKRGYRKKEEAYCT